MGILNICLIVLSTVLLFLTVFLVFLHVIKTKKIHQNINHQKNNLNDLYCLLEKKIKLSNEQLWKNWQQNIEQQKHLIDWKIDEYKQEKLQSIYNEIENTKFDKLHEVVLNSLEDFDLNIVNQTIYTQIKINEKMKAKIIGKKGRNLSKLQFVTGCDIVVDSSDSISISSANALRRKIACNTINHLIRSDAFDEIAITNVFEKEKNKVEQELIDIGKEYIQKMDLQNIDSSIFEYVGRLYYRHSYKQNVLSHSCECSKICRNLAINFHLDPQLAAQAGFFHDIGKSVDYENDYDHVNNGITIASKCNLDKVVIEAIAQHHSVVNDSLYTTIVKIADKASAGKIGARCSGNNEFVVRQIKLEKSCKRIKNVIDAYAIQFGKILQVIIDPDIDDKETLHQIEFDVVETLKAMQIDPNSIQINFCQLKQWTNKLGK